MNRVRQSIAALSLASLLTTGCASVQPKVSTAPPTPIQEKTGEIEQAFANQEKLVSLFRCDMPDANRLLVYIRQMHYLHPDYDKDPSRKTRKIKHLGKANIQFRTDWLAFKHAREYFHSLDYKRNKYAYVNAVQHQIYDILGRLLPIIGTKNVLVELASEQPSTETMAKEYYHELFTLEERRIINPLIREDKNMTHSSIYEELLSRYSKSSPNWSTFGYIPGAPLLMALEGDIEYLPATTPLAKSNAHSAIRLARKKGKSNLLDIPAVMDGREDAVLERANELPEPISTVVFGAAHSFGSKESCGQSYGVGQLVVKDNIATWNATHENKFSLLEITPRLLVFEKKNKKKR